MDKEEAIIDFLKGLRIVINNASAYFKEHPYFRKSVGIFKQKVNQLFLFLNPITINVTPRSLFIDNKHWEKSALYVELASMFHLRKIKGFKFSEALSVDELADFLSCVSMPIKEILRQGGLQNILNKEQCPHISVEELDYSQLLKDEGEEAKDVWVYLFRKSVQDEDRLKVIEFADNFEAIVTKFKAKDLLYDVELRQNLYNFLNYLKETHEDKIYNCTRKLLRSLLKDRDILKEENIDAVRLFFNSLDIKNLTEELWSGISGDEKFSVMNLAVFSRLIPEETNKSVASSIQERINNMDALNISPGARKKIKEIFISSDKNSIPVFYRSILVSLAQEDILSAGFSFDQEHIRVNYGLVLLNLFIQAGTEASLKVIISKLLKECDRIAAEKDFSYIKLILEAADKKIKGLPASAALFDELLKKIYAFIESEAFEDTQAVTPKDLITRLSKSFFGEEFYLNSIFNQEKINTSVLELWLKFFADKMPLFYSKLKEKSYDLELVSKIIKGFSEIGSDLSLEALKEVFYSSDSIMKLEVLKVMQGLNHRDTDFLRSVLKSESFFLRKEALSILVKDDTDLKPVLELLFSLTVSWRKRNKFISENMKLVYDAGLKEAKVYLTVFANKKFFWNSKIRQKAKEILEKWHD